ncbi:HIRAN domain-containing protein [Hirsutella rhossiliensis]|uniref:HIRAN domain-containing protein n=1 Tax=Hirsutella rhossiliensis TaxID=111463 RepID=A0A9P8MQN7_9HYPO|nr:HIRAN domain-containing protein [Hirsutella rhossiliensis]KAH0959475.1 HIRAN domain-containing protein [Hirsutella rhossiliensis]
MPRATQKRGGGVTDLSGDADQLESKAKRPAPAASQPPRLKLQLPSPSSQAGTQETEYLDLTQDDDNPPTELYGYYNSKIIGVRYYSGYASPGEVVLCHREPRNQYDRNANWVDNVMHQQIGYLPRAVVEKIAPYVDSGDITLEAQLTGGKGMVDCSIPTSLLLRPQSTD